MTDTAIEAAGLGTQFAGRQYGGRQFGGKGLGRGPGRRGRWALRDCTLSVPAGSVCALVGPNGAGKSTLLAHAAALLRPTEGSVTVLGTEIGSARKGAPPVPSGLRERVAYVAQDRPLYPQLTVDETLRMGRELNSDRWDARTADRVVRGGRLDGGARVRSLSGGQRTRLALALALGKKPELLLLDEPMADLDPLARHELMGALLAEAADNGTTVVMSSHILAELATACDHLLLLAGGQVRLAGPVDALLAAHVQVTGRGSLGDLAGHEVIDSRTAGRGLTALLRTATPVAAGWETSELSLEDVLLGHLRAADAADATDRAQPVDATAYPTPPTPRKAAA